VWDRETGRGTGPPGDDPADGTGVVGGDFAARLAAVPMVSAAQGPAGAAGCAPADKQYQGRDDLDSVDGVSLGVDGRQLMDEVEGDALGRFLGDSHPEPAINGS
jgi:hypothetical protein